MLEGEVGYVTDDPNQYKIGDGVHTWNELPLRGFDGTLVHELGNSQTAAMSQNFITRLITQYLSSAQGISAIVKKGNLLNGVSFVNGQYLNIANGEVDSMATYSYSDYIDIEGITTLMFSLIPTNGVCFYNADKEFISGYGSGSLGNYFNVIAEVPGGAKYMRVNVAIESRNDGTAYVINADPVTRMSEFTVKYPWLISEDKRLKSIPLRALSVKYQRGILMDNAIKGGFPSYNTYIFDISDYAGKDIYISATGLADANFNWDLYVLVLDDSTVQIVKNTVGNEISDYKVSLPANAKYLKMSSTSFIFISLDNERNDILLPELYTTQDVKNDLLDSINKLPLTGKTANIYYDDINLIRDVTFTEGKYLKCDDGKEIVFSTFSYTDYIDVSGISKLQISSVPENGGCFYDENKNFLSGFARRENTLSEYNAIVEVPENARYIRLNVSIKARNDNTAYMIDYANSPSAVEYPWLIIPASQLITPVGTANGYMADDGTINTSIASGGTITKYDVSNINSVLISISVNLSLGVNPKWCTIWVVDTDDTPILMLPVDTTGNILNNYFLRIPEGGKQLWVQSADPTVGIKSNVSDVLLSVQNLLQNSRATNQWSGKKIVWLGTSIPYGQGTDGTASSPTTYPMQVGAKLGANVVNVAQPGMAIETTDDFKRKTYGSLSLTIKELQSEGAATVPYQSYENAMLGQDADLYVFDCEPNNSNFDLTDLENFSVQKWAYNDSSTFESHRNSYVGALLFLLDKLWTEKPSAKVVFISEFISGADIDSKYQGLTASKAVADKLRIPLIDVASRLYYTPKNKSLYLNTDNVHPTQATHNRIANILAEELLSVN